MIVVDASALTDFLLGRPEAIEAIAGDLPEYEPLHAPELIEPETLSALRRLARNGAITDRRASDAVSDLGDVRLVRYPHAPLRARVWQLRHELSSNDATYLALAQTLGDCLLVTADAGLADRARNSVGTGRVRLI